MDNKTFIRDFLDAISGQKKTEELINQFVGDPKLLGEIRFYEAAFPKYELIPMDMLSEKNKVFVKAKFRATHLGHLRGIPPTFRTVEFPVAIEYCVQNGKITDHWLVFDRMSMMEQLGLTQYQRRVMHS